MTPVPPPATPCVRVQLGYTQADSFLAGSRFFLSYSGSAPSAGNCTTLAGTIATAWSTDIAPTVSASVTLTSVDVEDIASDSGAFGVVAVSHAGSSGGTALPIQVATNTEFDIGRRYRGGKPRIFWPGGTSSDTADQAHWTTDYVTAVNTASAAFFAAIAAASVGAMGTLAHVNLSYYKGFTNVTNSSGRTRAAPTYRPEALVDPITGYATKGEFGSQRRRRLSTSP